MAVPVAVAGRVLALPVEQEIRHQLPHRKVTMAARLIPAQPLAQVTVAVAVEQTARACQETPPATVEQLLLRALAEYQRITQAVVVAVDLRLQWQAD
jgi:hypothetical protein